MKKIFVLLFVFSFSAILLTAGALLYHFNKPVANTVTEIVNAVRLQFRLWNTPIAKTEIVSPIRKFQVTAFVPEKIYGQYTLISAAFSDRAQLIDPQGEVVHEWHIPFRKAWPRPKQVNNPNAKAYIESAWAFPNGDLIVQFSSSYDTPYGYGIAKVDRDSNILWTYDGNAHHDIYIDPQTSEIYAIVQSFISTSPSSELENLSYPMLVDNLVKLSPEGEELERISLIDAFLDTPYAGNLLNNLKGAKLWDQFHANSVTYIPPNVHIAEPFSRGGILVNIRNLKIAALIDISTKKVTWIYRGLWNVSHAVKLLANGNLIYFDNRADKPGPADNKFSRVVEVNPHTGSVAWLFRGNRKNGLKSMGHDRLQRLANGNTLIGTGTNNRLLEVTPEGTIAWNMRITGKVAWIGAMHRYTKEELPFLEQK